MDSFEIGSIAASLATMCLFLIHSHSAIICSPNKTSIQLGKNIKNAFLWLKKHTEKPDAPSVTLAIQTLRNTILVAIFVGGSAFTYSMLALNSITDLSSTREVVRSCILGICLFLSFLSWASVIRSASHLGYLVGVLEYDHVVIPNPNPNSLSHVALPVDEDPVDSVNTSKKSLPSEEVLETDLPTELKLAEAKRMAHVMLISFSFGFRFLFVSIPFAFMSVGPIALIISTVVILFFLYEWDHMGTLIA